MFVVLFGVFRRVFIVQSHAMTILVVQQRQTFVPRSARIRLGLEYEGSTHPRLLRRHIFWSSKALRAVISER